MQVSVEKTSELSRKMTVSIPEDVISQKVEARLKALAREVKVAGFRPGKVPQNVIKAKFADRARNEVTGDMIQSSYYEALQQQDLTPAGMPHIHPHDSEEGFSYTAEFEVYPTISLDGIETIEATRLVATVEDADFENMVQKLREQKTTWNTVERASQSKDRITINFSGVSEGENFTDGKVEDYPVEIGSNRMIPGFEDQLTGLKAGDSKSFEISFPEEYGSNQKLAGKPATFEIEVVKVEEPVLPEVNEEFIKQYGIESGDVQTFYDDVRNNMERELERALYAELKTSVLDALYAHVNPSVPNALVDQEINTMMEPYAENAKKYNLKLEDLNLPRDMFETQAKRRVALGLILGDIIEQQQIKIDEDKVRSTIEDLAQSYENPKEVVEWYYADKKRLTDIRQVALENQTVDWIISQIKLTDKNVGFSEIMDKQRQ
jgi:trigger factor